MKILAIVRSTAIVATSMLMLADIATASAPPPPPPLAVTSRSDDCGVGLGAAAGVGAGMLLLNGGRGPAASTWAGFYLGGQLGCSWSGTDWTFTNGPTTGSIVLPKYNSVPGQRTTFDNSGLNVGGILGYNLQFGQWVAGVEGTLSGGKHSDAKVNPLNPAPTVNSQLLSANETWIATVAGRLGYSFSPRFLAYGKVGFASADIRSTLLSQSGNPPSAVNPNASAAQGRHDGYTLGAGLEYMLDEHFVLGVGYDFIDLGARTYQVSCAGCAFPIALKVDPGSIHSVMGRLTYKIN